MCYYVVFYIACPFISMMWLFPTMIVCYTGVDDNVGVDALLENNRKVI